MNHKFFVSEAGQTGKEGNGFGGMFENGLGGEFAGMEEDAKFCSGRGGSWKVYF